MNFETLNIKTMKGNILVFDTETSGTIDKPIPYDFSLTITDTDNKAIFSQCYLISEIWNDFARYSSSYYGTQKRGIYNEMLAKGKAKVISAYNFNKELKQLIKNNNVNLISAYNLKFDILAYSGLCNEFELVNHLDNGKLKKLDIQLLAQERLRGNNNFKKWTIKNDLATPKGYCSMTVDNIYKYLFNSKKNELHIGLYDIKQENKILKKFVDTNPIVIINQYQSYNYFLKDLKID